MERIKLDGRLGFSLDISQEEFQVLTGSDRNAAKDLLVKLVQSEQCQIVGDTYFPVEWNEDILNYEMEDNLSFDLPVISREWINRNPELEPTVDNLIGNAKSRVKDVQSVDVSKEMEQGL